MLPFKCIFHEGMPDFAQKVLNESRTAQTQAHFLQYQAQSQACALLDARYNVTYLGHIHQSSLILRKRHTCQVAWNILGKKLLESMGVYSLDNEWSKSMSAQMNQLLIWENFAIARQNEANCYLDEAMLALEKLFVADGGDDKSLQQIKNTMYNGAMAYITQNNVFMSECLNDFLASIGN